MNPLTLVIPTYERPEFLAECLESIAAQTRQDFDLVVLDNASERDYRPVLERFEQLSIEYIRNEANIGSGPNQAKARDICARSEFGMVFHDDDLMHPRLIEWELGILEAHPRVVWAAVDCFPFSDGTAPPFELWEGASGRADIYSDQASLLRRILGGGALHFGSVLFRSTAIAAVEPRMDALREFHILADRPYLLELGRPGSTAVIPEPLVLYRLHGGQDTHDPNLTENQAVALMHYYRDILPRTLDPEDARLFFRHSTNYLLHVHSFTRPENRSPFRGAVKRERDEGLFRWRSIDGQGVAALATMAGFGQAFAAVRPVLGAVKRAVRPRSG